MLASNTFEHAISTTVHLDMAFLPLQVEAKQAAAAVRCHRIFI